MKNTLGFIIFFVVSVALCGCVLSGQYEKIDNQAQDPYEAEDNRGNDSLYPFKFYQDYISSVDGNRCQMYPTCSQYCLEAFKKHGTFLGWIMCSDRLMRCGRDEKTLSDQAWVDGERRNYDPVSNNDFWRQ